MRVTEGEKLITITHVQHEDAEDNAETAEAAENAEISAEATQEKE